MEQARSRGRTRYRDRDHAGRVLASHLAGLVAEDVVVLALPRGGVPVAAPIARWLAAPLSVVVVRKLGVPGHSELAMGAVASVSGRTELVRNASVIQLASVSQDAFDRVCARETAELERLVLQVGWEAVPLAGRVVVVVDDGLATGSTMLAAVAAIRQQRPMRVVVAVPVGARQSVALVSQAADTLVCPSTPEPFIAVGGSYKDFSQVSDREVSRLLSEGRA